MLTFKLLFPSTRSLNSPVPIWPESTFCQSRALAGLLRYLHIRWSPPPYNYLLAAGTVQYPPLHCIHPSLPEIPGADADPAVQGFGMQLDLAPDTSTLPFFVDRSSVSPLSYAVMLPTAVDSFRAPLTSQAPISPPLVPSSTLPRTSLARTAPFRVYLLHCRKCGAESAPRSRSPARCRQWLPHSAG